MRVLMEVFKIKRSREERMFDVFLVNKTRKVAVCVCVSEAEALAIAMFMDKKYIPKPLSYDLFAGAMSSFEIQAKAVLVDSFSEGVYGTNIVLSSYGEDKMFDCRFSDAINLALRMKCPIYIKESVLRSVGFEADVLLARPRAKFNGNWGELASHWNLNMLEELLQEAVDREDYELAVLLRDKIDEIKKEGK